MSHRRQDSGKGKNKAQDHGRHGAQHDDSSGDEGGQYNYGPPETDQGYQPTELHEDDDRPVKPDYMNYPSQATKENPLTTRDRVQSYSISGQPGFNRWAQRQGAATHVPGYQDPDFDRRGPAEEVDDSGEDPEDDQHGATTDHGQEEDEEEGHGGTLARHRDASSSEDESAYAQPARTSSQNVEPARDSDEEPYPSRRIRNQGSGHRKHH